MFCSNNDFLILLVFFCLSLSLTLKISIASQVGIGSSQNMPDTFAKKGDQIRIQTFPFNYNVYSYPSRENNKLENETKIVGGTETEPHEFPHMLAVYFRKQGSKIFHFGCGASILNRNFAVIAAHCVESERQDTVRVLAGEHDRSKNEGTEVLRKISEIIIHEDYSGDPYYYNDIAILRFNTPLKYNDNIGPIQLATRSRNTTGNVVVCGWGDTTDGGTLSMVLRKVTVPVVPLKKCQQVYPKLDDGQICAGFEEGGKDACQGDSGGPLMQMARRGDNHVLVGLVSYGDGCAKPAKPGIYTNMAKYREWVDSRIKI